MLSRITSSDNAKVKLVRKLQSRKGRSEESKFVAEGINLVSELIIGDPDIEFLMISSEFDRSSDDERLRAVCEYIDAPDTAAFELDSKLFNKLTDAEHGIDVLAVVGKKEYDAEFVKSLPRESCLLVCDRIQDPGNMGTMIRTAVAAGYSAIIALPGTVDVYSPKVLRATAGKVFDMPVVYISGEEELKEIAEETARRIVVTVPAGGNEYYKEDLQEGIALVIGNEGRGISESIIDMADVRVTLPMKGNIESLNAAVAAAILMYEANRR
jgi:TrmH family RNA methyltransferase